MEKFVFTPENLLANIEKLGAWSSYGLAETALQHYFPDEYPKNEDGDFGFMEVKKEVELLQRLGCNYWNDAVEKYRKEVGYTCLNPKCVNEY